MDFDEIEYLEKTVEGEEDREGPRKGRKEAGSERSYRRRETEEEDEEYRREKKSRIEDEENGHGSRRRKDKDHHRRDRERDEDGDRERERHARDKERDKERDRDKEKGYREKERDRRNREKEKERERDRDRGSDKTRDRKDRDRDRDKEKERDRLEKGEKENEREKESDRDSRERSRSRSRSRRRESDRERERDFEMRESRRFKDKKEIADPEPDPERDQKTVFAYQMPLKASERDVYEFFSKAGKVRDVRLIMDRNSRRSKGVGYIEFYDPMSVPMAIALSGQLLLGQPVMVKPSEAEKNLVQSNSSAGGAGGGSGLFGPVDRKLYVGNLHFNMTELQLRQLFEPYGTVELVQMPLDLETGHCKGFGFVQFASVESAKIAQSELNGKLEIAGRYIKVSSVTEHGGQQDSLPKPTDLDDDEGGGMALNAQSRAMLMQKLDRTGTAASIVGSLGLPLVNSSSTTPQSAVLPVNGQSVVRPPLPGPMLPPHELIGQPSECLLLKNMFDPATETEPDFDMEIRDDVEAECSKYGRVKHIYVDRNSAGFVYLRFDSIESAARAQRAMHMRWFAQRSISAIFMPSHDYESKFRNGA